MTEAAARGAPAPLTLTQVAELVGGRLEGDGTLQIDGIGPVDEAGPSQMAFLAGKRYVRFVSESRACAYLVAADLEEYAPTELPRVVVEKAHPALRAILGHFFPEERTPAVIHPTAVIGEGVSLGEDVSLGAYTVVEDGASIGDGCRIGPHCVIGRNARVGVHCHLYPQVVVYHEAVIGDRAILHAGARVGADGFGYTFVDGAHRKMPQVGRCIVGDDVEIGANSTLDRGSLGDTRVGDGVKIDNLVQVAHNVRIGDLSLLAALVGVAGSTRVGRGVWMGGQVGVSNHLTIGDGARMAIATKVMRDIPAGETYSGHPGRPHREQMRKQAHVGRLEKLLTRVKRLEEEVSRRGGAEPDVVADD